MHGARRFFALCSKSLIYDFDKRSARKKPTVDCRLSAMHRADSASNNGRRVHQMEQQVKIICKQMELQIDAGDIRWAIVCMWNAVECAVVAKWSTVFFTMIQVLVAGKSVVSGDNARVLITPSLGFIIARIATAPVCIAAPICRISCRLRTHEQCTPAVNLSDFRLTLHFPKFSHSARCFLFGTVYINSVFPFRCSVFFSPLWLTSLSLFPFGCPAFVSSKDSAYTFRVTNLMKNQTEERKRAANLFAYKYGTGLA